jgi:hypothetical protein
MRKSVLLIPFLALKLGKELVFMERVREWKEPKAIRPQELLLDVEAKKQFRVCREN